MQQRRHEETKARLEETKARLEEQRNRHELELQQLRLRLAEASMLSPMLFACFTAAYRFTIALLLLYYCFNTIFSPLRRQTAWRRTCACALLSLLSVFM